MLKMNSRLHEVKLPINKEEALLVMTEYLFDSLKVFQKDGFNVIQPTIKAECYTYAIIDAMKKNDISVLLDAYETEWECLWKGNSEQQYAFYAPYIVKIKKDTPFSEWLLSEGWNKEWGVFIRSYYPLDEVTHHLRKFNQIYDEVNHIWVLFRYYSAVAVEKVIPSLPPKDFIQFFSKINQIISEDSNGNLLII